MFSSSLVRRIIRSLLFLSVAWQVAQGIVGGKDAEVDEFPHHALLGYTIENSNQYMFSCGGILVSDQYVLTAAHCASRLIPVVVRLGESSLKSDNDNQVDYEIETIIKYEKYQASQSYHDIALVKLKQKVKFNDHIRPACLWRTPELNLDSVIATGFGLLKNGEISDTLQKVQLAILDKSECDSVYTPNRKFPRGIIDEQLCVGSKVGGKDSCRGDAGGPIQVVSDSGNCTHSIVGITSMGRLACGEGHSPSIYTRVSSYIDWIDRTVSSQA